MTVKVIKVHLTSSDSAFIYNTCTQCLYGSRPIQTHIVLICAAVGIRVSLSEHRQRQALPQPGADGHQARHGPDGVHVLRAVPRHDQVSDYLRKRHPQRLAGMFQEDCRKGATYGNYVGFQHRGRCATSAVSPERCRRHSLDFQLYI